MENGKEGCASPTVVVVDFEFAIACPPPTGGGSMPKIPDNANEIEIPRVAKHNLEVLQMGTRLNQLQITHL